VVDVANVMGARADGWWRNRAEAALRLGREVVALARRGAMLPGNGPAGAWVLVVEGRARVTAEALMEEAAAGESSLAEVPLEETLPGELVAAETDAWAAATRAGDGGAVGTGRRPLVRVVSAPGSGDDAIVGVVAEIVASDEICLVVTADRGLRQRCEDLNAAVVGPGWLLRLL
jgi:8-oxo-dGTP diphosphatase